MTQYTMFFDEEWHEFSGIITKCERNKNVCGTTYKLELMHNDRVVDTAWINDWDNFEPESFNNVARQMYDDMVEYALSQREN